MTTVSVMLGDRSYPILIRWGSLPELGEALVRASGSSRVVLVTTPKVGDMYAETVESGLESAGFRSSRLEVPDGERAKTLATASRLYDQLLELEADRETCLIGLGGGAACDLVGFVASTFLRGVPLVQVPTTLLAQVDASVGGKTAVNHQRGKNLIGTFYQPRLVWIDPEVLTSLSVRERRAGLAEIVKVAAIWDAAFFETLEGCAEAIVALEPEPVCEAIARACAIKAEVVGLDEREAGLRALLNFGHTLGHAIENVSGYREVTHGEAVAMGMVSAARLSEERELCPPGTCKRLRELLDRVGLPTQLPESIANRSAYLQAIAVDKKIREDQVGFVVLREIGRAEVVRLTPDEILAGVA
ncbi:MAG: 3-dehydroquinate synthase [Myxococcota bacterium]